MKRGLFVATLLILVDTLAAFAQMAPRPTPSRVDIASFGGVSVGQEIAPRWTTRAVYGDVDGINFVLASPDGETITFVLSEPGATASLGQVGGFDLWYRRAPVSTQSIEAIQKGLTRILRAAEATLRNEFDATMENVAKTPVAPVPSKTSQADAERLLQALTGTFAVAGPGPVAVANGAKSGGILSRGERLPGKMIVQQRGEVRGRGQSRLLFSLIGYDSGNGHLWYFGLTDTGAPITGWGDWNAASKTVAFRIERAQEEPGEYVVVRLANDAHHRIEHYTGTPEESRVPDVTLTYERQ